MLVWRHSASTVHNQLRVAANDAEGRRALAGYMLRAPFPLEKTTYDAGKGAVIYRSGNYSSRTRGAKRERPEIEEPDAESASQARPVAKAAWAKLIRKVRSIPSSARIAWARSCTSTLAQPEPELKLLLDRLNSRCRMQPPPKITALQAATARPDVVQTL